MLQDHKRYFTPGTCPNMVMMHLLSVHDGHPVVYIREQNEIMLFCE